MEIIRPDTPTQQLIREREEQSLFKGLKIGDIVYYYDDISGKSVIGVIIEKEYDRPVVRLVLAGDDQVYTHPWYCTTRSSNIIKPHFVSLENIAEIRNVVDLWYARSKDNLTYVEILSRLNEYDQSKSK